jgi:hypothetical protein
MAASDLPLHIRQRIEHRWSAGRKRLEECSRGAIAKKAPVQNGVQQELSAGSATPDLSDELTTP